jgi:membrane-bound lytic murein transglycosylase B
MKKQTPLYFPPLKHVACQQLIAGKAVFFSILLVLFFLLVSAPLFAKDDTERPNNEGSFIEWRDKFKQFAVRSGINKDNVEQAFDQLKPNETVLKLDASQPEFSRPIWAYVDGATTNQRIAKGKKILKTHQNLFNKVVKEYHVPAEIIIAIWAMESDFGGNYGNMNVVQSLATLAYDGKRKQFAEKELLTALRVMQNEKLASTEMVGSWAGAIGHPQFMPSSFEKYAVDFNVDGKRDLWNSLGDAFASIANYIKGSGWKENQSWGVEIVLPSDFKWQKQAHFNKNNERLTVSEWMLWGVRPASDKVFESHDQLATLFFPAGHLGPVFLVFDNFEVIKKYNLSLSYSLAVGLLASSIADETQDSVLIAKWPRKDKSLSREDKIALQTALNQQGFEAGKVDGKVGSNTRKAIRQWQLKQGLAADGYMPLRLFEKIEKSISE